MKTIIHKAETRGHANHGWLNSHHTFSFAGYYDPSRINFGALRVLNDDIVTGGRGFGQHPHDNMEIISIPLKGALEHGDNTGGHGIIKSGEVQIMSAGSGIAHSEKNASATETVNFLQIWVFPKVKNIQPRYDQKLFPAEERINKFQTVVSPEKDGKGLWINQDAWFSLGKMKAGFTTEYTLNKTSNGVYAFV
ncbi:MAG TPA: pirin family protein, partial [Cyclobacteriaceae bacterium]|nr:pirin family protein [Cyclobacteriaceae bacterium]